jgi:uncharacterized membrane protein
VRSIKRHLVTGFLVVAPISITIFLLFWFVGWIDHMLSPVVYTFLGRHIPGFGLAVGMLLLLVVGWLSSNIMGQHLLEVIEDFLMRIPVFNWLYRTVKQLTEAFTPTGSLHFKSVVMVEYPRPGVHQLGFVTKRVEIERDGELAVNYCVYIPTNHLYIGDIVLVPAEKTFETDIPLQEGVQIFLSAGASLSGRIHSALSKDNAAPEN